jgi:ATP-dependent DNA helicase Rep
LWIARILPRCWAMIAGSAARRLPPLSLPDPAATTLNRAQMEAVHHLGGPCLVLAGAGSGKTRVIVHKIARLLQHGLAPARIAAITFTNKAAAEMRERSRTVCGPRAAKALVVSTFHSLGVRMLREDGERIGLKPNFSILDSDDVLGVLREVGGHSDNAAARRSQWAISLWKNQGLDADAAERAAGDDEGRVAARVMRLYHERLAAFQAVDFDDLLVLPLKLLQRDAESRAKWQAQFEHVLVDEVQDTNAVQYALLKELVGRHRRFTAVGDDDQSIYGWRGATLDNLKQLPADFPELKVIALEQNYRSTGHILRAANAVIAHNPKLFEKKLWSELGEGEPVRVLEADSEEHEAERAVARVQALRGNAGASFKDVAVLYRANHQSRVLEQKLRAAQIPYKVSGGTSFFDRTEIRDLCAWLRLLVNADDDPAFMRAIATPKRGIGATTLATLGEFASKGRLSLFDAIFAPSVGAVLKGRALDGLEQFAREVNELEHRARTTTGREDAHALLMGWLKDIAYEQHLYDSEDSDKLAAARWKNVLDFCDWIARRCGGEIEQDTATFETERQSVWQVAQTISVIISLAERGEDTDVVTLSTLHAAKGLEWPHVMLVGVNEGVLPFKSDDEAMTAERLAEERRLMYVGITRAQKTLLVSTLKRRKRGRDGFVAATPSRFIAEMKLEEQVPKENPLDRIKRLKAALGASSAPSAPSAPAESSPGAPNTGDHRAHV